MINADCTSNDKTSYVGFNFIDRVEQYSLNNNSIAIVYYAVLTQKFIKFSYSPNYLYFFAI